ncbi:hypothetical protein AB0J83_29475 [Actinoplanes sp. NPDC049596]|uniref:hypothetical protein n=1 Tax=unclassified Actinoplanes TaxID=2626549 RepID=UPI00342B8FF6
MTGLRFEILGPLRAYRAGEPIDLGPLRQQAVLALLLLQPGHPIPLPEIVAVLWSGDPPENGDEIALRYIGNLRRALDPSLIKLTPHGYVTHATTDADLFRTPLTRPGEATPDKLREALSLWKSAPLPGLTGPFFNAARARLTSEHAQLTARLRNHTPPTPTSAEPAPPSRAEPAHSTPSRAEPAQPTPARTGPAQPTPAHAEPAQPTPARTGPAQPTPAHTEPTPAHAELARPPAHAEPARSTPAGTGAVHPAPTRTMPVRSEPTRAAPDRLDPTRVETGHPGPSTPVPAHADPARAEAANSDPDDAEAYSEPVDPWDGHDLFPPDYSNDAVRSTSTSWPS